MINISSSRSMSSISIIIMHLFIPHCCHNQDILANNNNNNHIDALHIHLQTGD